MNSNSSLKDDNRPETAALILAVVGLKVFI
jgi:hypothetical protein